METPKIHYLKDGWIQFHKTKKGDLYYVIMQWVNDGESLILFDKGKVVDEKELQILLSTEKVAE